MFSYSSCNAPSNRKKILYYFGFLNMKSRVSCWCVLLFFSVPFFGAVDIHRFLNTGPNQLTINSISVIQHVYRP